MLSRVASERKRGRGSGIAAPTSGRFVPSRSQCGHGVRGISGLTPVMPLEAVAALLACNHESAIDSGLVPRPFWPA